MKTDRFSNNVLRIVAGKTRTFTQKTVVVGGSYLIECCPFPQVDEEMDYILRMAKQWIANFRNPFATASWIHLALAKCHPFEDGNGRIVRLLASIPLIRHGYPPISISLAQRSVYYAAINKAYQGDHKPMIECIMQGMQETIESVQNL
ncbi:fido domain-containing protein [Lyophyllum atratum]|nr:fido domain-containing protein [Lyophyllum atratum]